MCLKAREKDMGVLWESKILVGIALFLVFVLVLFGYFRYKFTYWKRKGVPFLRPSFPFGNVKDLVLSRKAIGVVGREFYEELARTGKPFGGFYTFARPIFMPVDPDLIRSVLVKDFACFHDRGIYYNEEIDPLSAHMASLEGQAWKNLRMKLSPTFSPAKIKTMLHILVGCSKELGVILERSSESSEPIDIKDIARRFTTDVIGSCAFGLDCNSLKDPESEFRFHGKRFFEVNFFDGIKRNLQFMAPEILRACKAMVTRKDTTKFFIDVVKQTVDYREANKVDRKDMMSFLLKLKNNESLDDETAPRKDETGLTFNQLVAQCFIFFLGGFETSSTTMSFLLLELSQNQEIQDKLRQEIRQVLANHPGQLTFEALTEMTYMDKVISETLRKHPPVPMLNRTSSKDWVIPGTDVVIEKGTKVLISSFGLHSNPEYFPEPDVFDPERFTEENKAKMHPYCYLPFGEGPRNCIAAKFGLAQTKVGLTAMLTDYKFELHPRTTLPVIYELGTPTLSHAEGIWLKTLKCR